MHVNRCSDKRSIREQGQEQRDRGTGTRTALSNDHQGTLLYWRITIFCSTSSHNIVSNGCYFMLHRINPPLHVWFSQNLWSTLCKIPATLKIVILAKIIGMWLFYNYKTCEMFSWEVTRVSAFTKLIFRSQFDSYIPHSQAPPSFPLLTVL